MIKLLQRTETEKLTIRRLWQQADIGRVLDYTKPWPHTPIDHDSCYYCRYKQTFANLAAFEECARLHGCYLSEYPFIDMSNVLSGIQDEAFENPDGTTGDYQRTGIYKQVKFEAQPHHVQLILCNNGQAMCNANCWYHAWRLKNKRTVRQCGESHLCQNDGSLWAHMAPDDDTLREEFINQL